MIEVYKIPFNNVESAGVSLKDKDNSWSLKRHAEENGWNIAINGAMFSNGKRGVDPYYYWNITDMVIDGVLNRGGNYSNAGIAIGNPFAGISAYWSTTDNCVGKPVDFIGGAPTMIVNGVIKFDMKGLSSSFASNLTQRTALGIDKENFYICTTKSGKHTLYEVAKVMLSKGCLYAIDLDGGGSTAFYNDKYYFTQGRNITSAFGIKLKKKYKVALDAGHNILNQSNQSQDGSYKEFEHNINVVQLMIPILERHGIDVEFIDVENASQTIELNKLVTAINDSNADICVSVHTDASANVTAVGQTIFSYGLEGSSYDLAVAIHGSTVPEMGMYDRGIKDGSELAIVGRTTMTTVLIETGFHTNMSDLIKLKSKEFRQKEAELISKGIVKYFGLTWIPETVVSKYKYSVQVGSFENLDNANALKAKLLTLGIDSTIETEVK